MADYEVFAPDDATMQLALTAIGIRKGDGLTVNKVRFCVNYYGAKYTQSGTRVDINGTVVPDMVPQAGVYAIVRWVPPNVQQAAFPPAGVALPSGVTVVALPANTPVKFA